MGFNKRKMEDRRHKAAEQEAAARRATEKQILEDAEHLVAVWNARQAAHMPMVFSPTIEAAITAGYWFLRARCPACRTTGDVDLRKLDWHRAAIAEVRRQHGDAAFVDCREAVAQHEAGHAVVAAAERLKVARVELFAAPVAGISAGSRLSGFQLGRFSAAGRHHVIDADSDPIADLKDAHIIVAGRAAEMLSPHGLPGCALDEVVASKAIAEIAARKLNVDAEELWECGVWRPALAACQLNRATIDRIARRLLRRGIVDGARLQSLLRGVKRPEGIYP